MKIIQLITLIVASMTSMLSHMAKARNLGGSNACRLCEVYNPSNPIVGVWGSWVGETSCSGVCNNASERGNRTCRLHKNGTQIISNICLIAQNGGCENLCAGHWGQWTTVGECSTQCGTGYQNQIRGCFQNISGEAVQVTNCFGKNASQESREKICRITCNSTTIPTTTTTQFFTRTRIQMTTIQQETEVLRSTKPSQTSTPKPRVFSNANFPKIIIQSSSGQFDTIALASVLGVAAIIFVVIAFVAAVYVFTYKKSPKSHVVTYAANTNGNERVLSISVVKTDEQKVEEDQPILSNRMYDLLDTETGLNAVTSNSRETAIINDSSNCAEALYSTVDDHNK